MDDIPAIMQFVEKNWKENHILARDEEFFHWMYTDEEGCNVVLAEDEHNDICGMIGVIKYNSTKIRILLVRCGKCYIRKILSWDWILEKDV